MVTIITATRNIIEGGRETLLRRCVESVARLRILHEHLIVDGASTDGTVEFLMKLRGVSDRIKIVSEPDSGIYDAFNKGVDWAKDGWVYFLGSDDYLFSPETFEEVVATAEATGAAMTISPVRYSDGREELCRRILFRNVLIVKPYCHQGVLMQKSVFRDLGLFDASLKITADFKLCLLAHLANIRHCVIWKSFAEFTLGLGVSGLEHELEHAERVRVPCEVFRLTEKERDMLLKKQLLPFRILLPLVAHNNEIIRYGAQHAIKRRLANMLGLLDSKGGPRWFCRF